MHTNPTNIEKIWDYQKLKRNHNINFISKWQSARTTTTQKKIQISGLILTATASHEQSLFFCSSSHSPPWWWIIPPSAKLTLASPFFLRLFWCGSHCCFGSSPPFNLSLSLQPQQQCPTLLCPFKNCAKTEDEQGPSCYTEWQKSFGPPKATELLILKVTWGIVDNIPPLLSWTTPIKEVMQTSAWVTGQKRWGADRKVATSFLPVYLFPDIFFSLTLPKNRGCLHCWQFHCN